MDNLAFLETTLIMIRYGNRECMSHLFVAVRNLPSCSAPRAHQTQSALNRPFATGVTLEDVIDTPLTLHQYYGIQHSILCE